MRFMTMWIYKNTLNSEDCTALKWLRSAVGSSSSQAGTKVTRKTEWSAKISTKNHENFKFLGYRSGRDHWIERQK